MYMCVINHNMQAEITQIHICISVFVVSVSEQLFIDGIHDFFSGARPSQLNMEECSSKHSKTGKNVECDMTFRTIGLDVDP